MTTVVSHHDLEALPVGATMEVHDPSGQYAMWTRVADGWSPVGGTAVLDSRMFEGLAKANRIGTPRLRVTPEPGQWWEGTSYWYLIHKVDGQTVSYFRFRRATSGDWRHMTSEASNFNSRDRVITAEAPTIRTDNWVAVVGFLTEFQDREAAASERRLKNSIQKNDLADVIARSRRLTDELNRLASS